MKNITVSYGPEHLTKQVADDTTVGDIKTDSSFKAGLGFGDNVNVLKNGVAMSNDTYLEDGAHVTVETACNKKAS